MATNKVKIEILAQDKASKKIGVIKKAFGGLTNVLGAAAVGATAAGVAIGAATIKLAKDAIPVEGITKALNRGIVLSRGKYLARQDADDISLCNRIEKEVVFLENNSDCGLIGTHWDCIDEYGNNIFRHDYCFLIRSEDIKECLPAHNPIFHSSVMFRKEVIKKVGLYNENLCLAQDYEFWVRIAKYYKICNLPDRLMIRRYHSKTLSLTNRRIQILNVLKIKIFAINYLRLPYYRYAYSFTKSIIELCVPYSFVLLHASTKSRFFGFFKKLKSKICIF